MTRVGDIEVAAAVLAVFAVSSSGWASPAAAFEGFAVEVPCVVIVENAAGTPRPCITCHDNPDGGNGCDTPPCQNAFGEAFFDNDLRWDATLAMMDADGDGYTNGEELGDPAGVWTIGLAPPSTCACASQPGFATFTPADADSDGDRVCCRGVDSDGDGTCRGAGEHDGSFDCDDTDDTVASTTPEVCTNRVDNDCDGLATLRDPDCESVVDRDGDGFCPMGTDLNADGDCNDPGESTGAADCDDSTLTVRPGAPENCRDTLDNDCNGLVDELDPMCRGDADMDDDGYCPIGRDLNDDGDCLDLDEELEGLDCDDTDPTANPDQVEVCTDGVDNDCDGFADFVDPECEDFFDADGDGYCVGGRDGNGDGDCVDADEVGAAVDCDDADPLVSPGAAERCVTAVDEDCDGAVGLADPDCVTHLDGDGDGYCAAGFDMNVDGDCADEGEPNGNGDCDDTMAAVFPGAEELCTNGLDDDCDGVADALDRPTCDAYRDRDGDGWCEVGRDLDGDGGCVSEGEVQEPNDLGFDDAPTIYPGAPENCFDERDNDLDGEVDEAAACTRESDADGDGYCPVGRDVNGDGDCLDEGENLAVSDCDDGDPEIGPGGEESCLELVDRDCDGDIGLVDTDCFVHLDRDGDRFCGIGMDDNGDGDCADTGEGRFGEDCDDGDSAVNPRALEDCENGIDDDCDGDVDRADAMCPCVDDSGCADGDPCTRDVCRAGECSHEPDPACVDGGPSPDVDAGTEPPPDDGGDCSCRAAGTGGAPTPLALLALVAGLLLRRRRRVAAVVPVLAIALAASAALPSAARARPGYRNRIPQGFTWGMGSRGDGCLACHTTVEGGFGCEAMGEVPPCLNTFAEDFNSNVGGRQVRQWDAWLRDRDSDGDGRTNGQELIYFGSAYSEAGFVEGDPALATQPGLASDLHTDECFLQASTEWGYLDHPNNYTNCAAGAVCTDDSDPSATPAGSRYFGFTCSCPMGQGGNGRRDVPADGIPDPSADGCSPIDECALYDRCLESLPGNSCTDTPTGYDCTCDAAWYDASSVPYPECLDRDECAPASACARDQSAGNTCTNQIGGFDCSCGAGFVLAGDETPAETCDDLDECALGDFCLESMPGNTCANTPGSYTCSCDGTWYTLSPSPPQCLDVNECADATRCGRDLSASNGCSNQTGGYDCTCGPGFTLSADETPLESCVDVDECAAPSRCGRDLDAMNQCSNTVGAYSCACVPGYQVVGAGTPSETCADVNECLNPSQCNADVGQGTCTNTVGGYTCDCAPGYGFDGVTCVEESECTNGMNDCHPNATCIELMAGFDCACLPGFTGDGHTSGTGCTDIDECADATRCGQDQSAANVCTNTPGGYLCACGTGFVAQGSGDTATCVDVDECASGSPCGVGTCANTPGAYACSCPPGYDAPGTGGTCQDIDECGAPDACGRDLSATNTCANGPGSYSCSCGAGFQLAGSGLSATCVDVDECAGAPCGAGACTNTPGTYRCACPMGYTGPASGGTCSDVDECLDPSTCGTARTGCVNSAGSYACTCAAGYAAPASGGTCADVDECASSPCGAGATGCDNVPGTYRCVCDAGYAAPSSGGSCADIDECATDDPCAPGTCANRDGGYSCTCPTGFRADAGRCVDVDECAVAPCGNGACSNGDPGTYVCDCSMGYEGPSVGGTCTDIDECATSAPCDANAACTNTPGLYECVCNPGYEGPGERCNDIDECLDTVPDLCDVAATCTNTPGSHICTCREGYRGNGQVCEDVDECAEGSARCGSNERCVNRTGMPFECVCAPGFFRPAPDQPCVAACGDGVRGQGEQCDDGNDAAGDGCDACSVELGWVCTEPDRVLSVCRETCGDGLVHLEAGEECDDAEENSDTEPNACRLRCVLAHCGDGVLDDGEECDDGALSDELPDACRTTCEAARCGDGVIDTGETCDPGGGARLDDAVCEGPCEADGGAIASDAGVPDDAGGGVEDGGCSCRAAPRSRGAPAAVGLLLALFAVVRRRR